MASPYWQMVKDKNFEQVPDTYLDFLMGCEWFVLKWSKHAKTVAEELKTRNRSHYHVEDKYGKTLED